MVLLETQAHGADWLSLSNHHEIVFRLYPAYFSPKPLLVPSPISGTWQFEGVRCSYDQVKISLQHFCIGT